MKYFIWKTRNSYRKLAKTVVSEIHDYIDSGFEVVGIVGIKGSPSCGLSSSLDLLKSSEVIADFDLKTLTPQIFNDKCYENCLINTEGLFFEQLKFFLTKNNLKVNFFEHDLLEEIKGSKISIDYLRK